MATEGNVAPTARQPQAARTTYAVWEITLKCNLACSHCGSRAGSARPDELTTSEALDLVRQLAEVGIREVTLIGGEAYLRPDWLDIAREIVRCGMHATMTTGGYGLSRETARRMAAAGIERVSVSIDGLESTHDRLRGRKGSWKQALSAMSNLRGAGIVCGCNTQINRLSAPELPRVYELIRAAGAKAWQVQLTVPMGNAADNHDILLQPAELLDLYPMLATLARRGLEDGLPMHPGNNIGYYGPYERLLRGGGSNPYAFWRGCQAGLQVLGLEADGSIKGCPSLPTSAYTGGNIRTQRLRDIIINAPELGFNLAAGTKQATDHLWGFCQTCELGEVCRAGCSWTSHVFFNRRGNNVYCHHRALELQGRGLRERVVRTAAAHGLPFDNGVFAILEEPADAPWPADDSLHFSAQHIVWPERPDKTAPDVPADPSLPTQRSTP